MSEARWRPDGTTSRYFALKQRVLEDSAFMGVIERLIVSGAFDKAVVPRAMALGWAPPISDDELDAMHRAFVEECGPDD